MLEILENYWPFLAAALVVSAIMQILKKIFSKEAAKKSKWYKVGRLTLPLQSVLLGALFGLLSDLPLPDTVSTGINARVLYFAAAGVTSSWLYDTVKHWIKNLKKGDDE